MIGECETHPSITQVEFAAEAPDTMPSRKSPITQGKSTCRHRVELGQIIPARPGLVGNSGMAPHVRGFTRVRAMLDLMNDASQPRNAYPGLWALFEVIGEGAARGGSN
jgi:hypothetical protein